MLLFVASVTVVALLDVFLLSETTSICNCSIDSLSLVMNFNSRTGLCWLDDVCSMHLCKLAANVTKFPGPQASSHNMSGFFAQ